MRKILLMASAGAALVTLAGCGSGSGSSSGQPSGSSGSIHVASTSLGKVLVDGSGRTLYLLTADKPGTSTCDPSCLTYWPAVAPATSTSLPGVQATVGRTTTPGGDPIATVGGWPLYTYVNDKGPGDVTGQAIVSFGGTWYAVSADGQPVRAAPAPSTSPSSSGGNGY